METPSADLLEAPTKLELDPKHPGVHDPQYLRRRAYFFETSQAFRLDERGIPGIEYTEDEHQVWRHVCTRLDEAHQRAACSIYLEGKAALRIDGERIPQPAAISRKLLAATGLQLVPAEGLIPFREFFAYLARKRMPCTQYVRHGSRPEFTPEPDTIHDMVGHVPSLADPGYVGLIQLIGRATKNATAEQLRAFNRLYWFTIEFGLIQEPGGLKVFGAGLLSSIGEMKRCLSDEVKRVPFSMEKLIQTDYDPSRMQDLFFVLDSFEQLVSETRRLIEGFEEQRGS